MKLENQNIRKFEVTLWRKCPVTCTGIVPAMGKH